MIRHIVGGYEMTMEDLYRPQTDSIGTCGYFGHKGYWFEIPYRSLYVPGFPNIWAAGRVISADGDAWDAIRVIPVAAETGRSRCQSGRSCRAKADRRRRHLYRGTSAGSAPKQFPHTF